MRRLAFVIALSIAAGAAPVAAQVQSGPSQLTVDIGGVKIALVPPEGHCVKDRNIPLDRQLIENVERSIAGQNRLLMAFADCQQLAEAREGKRTSLDNFGQYMTPVSEQDKLVKLTDAGFIAEMRRYFRKQGVAAWSANAANSKRRLESAVEGLKLDENKMLGVIKSDGRAIYFGSLLAIRLPDGKDKHIVGVTSAGLIKGKIVNLNIYRDMGALAGNVVNKATEQNSATRAAFNAANRK